jgi:hypothetical protein
LNLKDEVARITKERQDTQEKLRRMAKAYIDGLIQDDEYNRQKKLMELHMESLLIPAANAAKEAGELITKLPKLWLEANTGERRQIIVSMLDGVYIDAKWTKSIVAIKPKPPFIPIFRVAVSKKESDIRILNEPLETSSRVPSVFLVETGESWSRFETRFIKYTALVHTKFL